MSKRKQEPVVPVAVKKEKPYKMCLNNRKSGGLRIHIREDCGFKPGQKFFQVLREDGVLELIPEKKYKKEKIP